MAGVLPVVILHWNRPERCLGTVARFLAQEVGDGVRVVVVDNGSTPDAIATVRAGLPDGVDLVELPRNRGFGPGANAGFRHVLAHPHGVRRSVGGAGPARRRARARLPRPHARCRRGASPRRPGLRGLRRRRHADRRPVLRRDPRAGQRRRGLGAGRAPARHLDDRAPDGAGGGGSVRRAVLRLLRGGGPGPARQGGRVGDGSDPRGDRGEPRSRHPHRGHRLPPAPQHPAARPRALRSLPRHDPLPPRHRAAPRGARVAVPAGALLGPAGPGAGARSTTLAAATAPPPLAIQDR